MSHANLNTKSIWQMLKETFWQWYDDNPFRLGASLAYYTIFSIAPIVLIAIAITSLVFGEESRSKIIESISGTVGERVGLAIGDMLQYTSDNGSGVLATVISVV